MKGLHLIELGQWPPLLYVTNNKRAYNRFMRAMKVPDPQPFPSHNGGNCQQLVRDNECRFVIGVGSQDDEHECASTLAHEATHAMRWMLEYVGEHSPGTETQAYLVGHIVKCGLRALAA